MRIGPSFALAFGLVASAVVTAAAAPSRDYIIDVWGTDRGLPTSFVNARRADARRLPVDRDAERAAPLRRAALRRLRSRQHAGAGPRPRRAPVRRRPRHAVGQHLRRLADLGAARRLPARMDRRAARSTSKPSWPGSRGGEPVFVIDHGAGDPAPRRRRAGRLGRPPSARRRAAALRRGRDRRAVGAHGRRRAVAAARRALRAGVDGRPGRPAGPVPGPRRRRPGLGRHRRRDRGVRRRPLPDDDADQRRGAARRLDAALLARRRRCGRWPTAAPARRATGPGSGPTTPGAA